MAMTLEEALQAFMEADEGMREALQFLREATKEEGLKTIQVHINDENFISANAIIEHLNSFTKLEFHSNADEISTFAREIFQEEGSKTSYQRTPLKKKLNKVNMFSNVALVTEEEIDTDEKEILKTLGYTAISRVKDATKDLNEEVLWNLSEKGYIEIEEIILGEKTSVTFELTEKGKEEFEKIAGIEANESFKSQLMKKHGSISKGFFLYDVENGLQQRDYQINEIGANQIEIAKDNRHFYLTVDAGEFEENDYFKILNRKNQLKNIGFICLNESVMNQAKESTMKWSKQNESKCKFLSVHFTTLDRIENEATIFQTENF